MLKVNKFLINPTIWHKVRVQASHSLQLFRVAKVVAGSCFARPAWFTNTVVLVPFAGAAEETKHEKRYNPA